MVRLQFEALDGQNSFLNENRIRNEHYVAPNYKQQTHQKYLLDCSLKTINIDRAAQLLIFFSSRMKSTT